MDFIEALRHNWSIIVFIGGAIWNIGYTYSKISTQQEKILELHAKIIAVEKSLEDTKTDFSDIKGDIKEINAKLDLLIKGKIK